MPCMATGLQELEKIRRRRESGPHSYVHRRTGADTARAEARSSEKSSSQAAWEIQKSYHGDRWLYERPM